MALIPPKIPQNINKLEVGSLLFDTTENKLKIFSDNYLINVGENLDFKAFKNYIINGNFLIWQRGTSFNTAGSTGGYTADRWRLEIVGNASATVTRTKSTTSDYSVINSPYYATISFTAGTDNSLIVFAQSIEDVGRLANKKVTISFWAKSDVPVKLWTEIKQRFNIKDMSQVGIGVTELNLTTEWKKYIVTVDIPQIPDDNAIEDPTTTATILYFWLEGSPVYNSRIPGIQHQSGVVHIAEVQLEEGNYPTSFENRPYGLELQLCKRYFERLDIDTLIGVAERTSTVVASLQYTQKRVVPTVTIVSYPKVIVADPKSTISAYADSVGYTVSKDGLGLGIYVRSISFTPQYAYKVRFLVLDIDAEF